MKGKKTSPCLPASAALTVRILFAAIAWCSAAGELLGAPFAKWIGARSPQGAAVRIWGQGDEYSASFEAEDGHAVVYDSRMASYAYARKVAETGALETTGIAVGDETPADRAALAAIPLHERDTSDDFLATRRRRIEEDESNAETLSRWRDLKADMRRRRKIRRIIQDGGRPPLMAPPSSPTVGTVVGLTLLVDFPTAQDGSGSLAQESHPEVTKDDLDQLVNGENFSKWGNASSVRKYFEDVSGGNLVYTNIVMGWFKAAHPRSYYDDPTKDSGICARPLIAEILEQIASSPEYSTRYLPLLRQISFSGRTFKALNVFFAGPESPTWSMGLWAHKSTLWKTSYQTKLLVEIGGATMHFNAYQISPVTESPSIGTFCHENGHLICGFPDLYNHYYEEDRNCGIGQTCLMGSGGANNPLHVCAYLRAAAGWVTPRELPPGAAVLSVSNRLDDVWSYSNPADESQYFLIENRLRRGRDASLPGEGVMIWRCDENGDNTHSSYLPGFDGMARYRRSYELSLEQADGLYELERAENSGQATDFWYRGNPASKRGLAFSDATEPCAKWKDGTDSGLMLSGFSEIGEVMTFHAGEIIAPRPTYLIDYSLGGGTFGPAHPSEATLDDAFRVSAPSRGNDTFIGWSVSGLNGPSARWGTTANPDAAIANAATRCLNGASGDVYFKGLAEADGMRVTLIANWRPAVDPAATGKWYVAAGWGDDSNSGRSWSAPFATIQKAVDSEGSMDYTTIVVYDGQYEPFEADPEIGWSKWNLQSVNGPERTIIDGSLQWSRGVTNRCATFKSTSQSLTGFTLMNGRAPKSYGGGSYRGSLSNCIYRCNSAIEGSGGGAYGSLLFSCLLYDNTARWGGGCFTGVQRNCTLSRNSAEYYGGGAYEGKFYNCIVWGNTARSDENIRSPDDCRFTCTTPLAAGEGNVDADPKFVDAKHGDFRLAAGSPCVNAGSNQYVEHDMDLDGLPRIAAGTVDMGAYEWTPIPTSVIVERPGHADVEIPLDWFATGKIGEKDCFNPDAFARMFGTDFAAAAKKPTGKLDAHGSPMYVWHDFIAGTDPTEKASAFSAAIRLVGGTPVITWSPDLNEGGTKSVRTYRILGIGDLSRASDSTAWEEVPAGNERAFRFFKVEVDMR